MNTGLAVLFFECLDIINIYLYDSHALLRKFNLNSGVLLKCVIKSLYLMASLYSGVSPLNSKLIPYSALLPILKFPCAVLK